MNMSSLAGVPVISGIAQYCLYMIWKVDTVYHTIESAFNQERSLYHAGPRKCHGELGGTRFEFVITLLINVNCFVDLNEKVV